MKIFSLFSFLAGFVFFSSWAHATAILSGSYQPSSQTLILEVAYQGGLKNHEFSLEWDACETYEGVQQVAARLEDKGWDDTGTDEIQQTLSFDLSGLNCRPSLLTVRSGRVSHITLWID